MPVSKPKKSTAKKLKPLWRCPDCGHRFVTKNTWHSCGTNTLKALFAHCEPEVFKLFRKFSKMVQACGPGKMITQQTRVVFQVGVRFAGCYPRKSYLDCAVALPGRLENPRFTKIVNYAEHFISHHFRVDSEADLNDEVQEWLRQAYRVGEQEDFADSQA
jgi:hypothetical protein